MGQHPKRQRGEDDFDGFLKLDLMLNYAFGHFVVSLMCFLYHRPRAEPRRCIAGLMGERVEFPEP